MEVLLSNGCSKDEEEYIISKLVEYNLENEALIKTKG